MKSTIVILVLIGALGGVGFWYVQRVNGDTKTSFRTTTVKKGDVLPTIASTGTLQPEEVVDVGAQVVGRIVSFGIAPEDVNPAPSDPTKKNFIDYNSVVHMGTDLAYIDDEKYRATVDQAKATLHRAQADLLQWQAKQKQAVQELARSEGLRSLGNIAGSSRPLKGITDSDYDLAVANEAIARSNVETAEAAIKVAEASLHMAETDLKYTVIQSPVEGVIIDRRVNVGQTVVASLNSPSLFLIAKDLTKMQVWASVNEADIGRIKKEMPVRFLVDAFPSEVFRGTVLAVRQNANMTQNVVTYTVVVGTDNANLRLRPYLTANLQFEVDNRKDVLTVPNVALRWKPKPAVIDPQFREANAAEKEAGKRLPQDGTSPGDVKPNKALKAKADKGKLWVRNGDFVKPVEVQVGVSDGVFTEVSGENVTENMEIVFGENRMDARGEDTTNPFAPKMPFGGPKKN